jgi:hypothetical protein
MIAVASKMDDLCIHVRGDALGSGRAHHSVEFDAIDLPAHLIAVSNSSNVSSSILIVW